MTSMTDFDRRLAAWLEAGGDQSLPAGLVDGAVALAAAMPQRRSPLDRIATRLTWPAVGLPGRRSSFQAVGLVVALGLLVAMLGGALLVASGALRDVPILPPRVYQDVFVDGRSPSISDFATQDFTSLPALPNAAGRSDARVLIVEGCFCGDPGRAELYDPATGFFALTGRMLEPRVGARLTRLADGRVLVAGGQTDVAGSILTSLELFDPRTGRFSPAGSLPAARPTGVSVALADGRVLILGAEPAVVFDPRTGTVSTASSDGDVHTAESAALLADGRVLLLDQPGAEVYDPTSRTFIAVANTLRSRNGAALIALADGGAMVIGGVDTGGAVGGSDPNQVAATELFDPATGAFELGPMLAGIAPDFDAVRLQDGRILVVYGGRFASAWTPGAASFGDLGTFLDDPGPTLIRDATVLLDGRVLIQLSTESGAATVIFQ